MGAPILILALTSEHTAASAIYGCGRHRAGAAHFQLDGVAEATVNVQSSRRCACGRQSGCDRLHGAEHGGVRLAIINANAAGPLGVFDSDGVAQTIATNAQNARPTEYRDIVVKSQNAP